ncbi:uncharacterized protein N7483_005087 [Penicillium malachiteum]|uniref:uncharacterized protein n=1 Tax=Penicillium malachiteum TaxID=1324776 RepID=UPI00254835D9|nr:uncharacterized protein N7483_005087 [Penicillium malachiteum]KAJ5730579.1 hypothetical protein N7483_005087 [Penicillium malachiteum]
MSCALVYRGIARPRTTLFTSKTSVLRYLSTQTIYPESPKDRLVAQRLRRPVSPHLSVYKWNYVNSSSALHRITGILLSGSLYGFATLYLFAPTLGLHLDSATIIEAFGSLPVTVKTAIKFGLTIPFTYHAFSGIKNLMWDSDRLLGKKQSGRATWIVLICSMSASLELAFYKPGEKSEKSQ